jgi:hypothetical protein
MSGIYITRSDSVNSEQIYHTVITQAGKAQLIIVRFHAVWKSKTGMSWVDPIPLSETTLSPPVIVDRLERSSLRDRRSIADWMVTIST